MSVPSTELLHVRLDKVRPNPLNPRQRFEPEALAELVESVKALGILEPLVLTPAKDGGYLVVAGERRRQAATQAGLTYVPAVVREMDTQVQLAAMLAENIIRADLDPIEEARGLRRMLDECEITQAELAQRLGKSQPWVANRLRLLRLPEKVLAKLESGELSPGHAQILLKYERAPKTVEAAAKRIIENKVPVSQAESTIEQAMHKKEVRRLSGYQSAPGSDPMFHIGDCANCPSAVSGQYGYRRCLDPVCWEEKQAVAKAAAEQRAKEIAEEVKSGATPRLESLKRGTYVDYWDLQRLDDKSQCERCSKHIEVLTSNDVRLKICVDPGCFAITKNEQERAANAEAQVVIDKMLAGISAAVEASPEDHRLAFTLCYVLLYSGTSSGRRPSGIRYGVYGRLPSREEFCRSELGIEWPKVKDDSWWDMDKEPKASAIRGFFESLLYQSNETLHRAIVKWLLVANEDSRLGPLVGLLRADSGQEDPEDLS